MKDEGLLFGYVLRLGTGDSGWLNYQGLSHTVILHRSLPVPEGLAIRPYLSGISGVFFAYCLSLPQFFSRTALRAR